MVLIFFVLPHLFWLGSCLPTAHHNCTHRVAPTLDHAGNPLPQWYTDLLKRKSEEQEQEDSDERDWTQFETENAPPAPPFPHGHDCPNDVIHDRFKGRGYFFSWKDHRTNQLRLNWDSAIRFCRARCMELVSIETRKENDFLDHQIERSGVKRVWTSGRKCDFRGCEDPTLQPADVYGWFWAGSNTQLPPTTDLFDSNWSHTGELGKPQPDNFEKHHGGGNESCLAIKNNAFNDGVRWHDEICSKRMSFVCEEKRHTEHWPHKPDMHSFYYHIAH